MGLLRSTAIGCTVALVGLATTACEGTLGRQGKPGSDARKSGSDGWVAGRDGRAIGDAADATDSRSAKGDAAAGADGSKSSGNSTAVNFKVAFIGDQGAGSNAKAVLKLIKREKADAVLHQGDFDYQHDPKLWDDMITAELGASFPYFASIGNHDTQAWSGYQKKLQARLARVSGAKCSGDLGVKSACTYKGLFFILSGVGTKGSGHESYITSQLAGSKALWKICSWHKNQSDMQVGGKGNSVGWGAYKACQNGGAIIATGHEHSYSRTKTLTALGDSSKGHGATGAFDALQVAKGRTFVFVSGLGGASKRDFASQHDSDTWWATYYTSNRYMLNGKRISSYNYTYGALFITFNSGKPDQAKGVFKAIDDKVIDSFTVTVQ